MLPQLKPRFNTQGMSIRQMELIKRTALMQSQPRDLPAVEEKRLAYKAIQMLNYVACLNYAIDDLKTDLLQQNMMHGIVARCFNISQRIILQAHDKAYKMLVSITPKVGREYNDALDATWTKIEDCICLESPERGFNIVVALCRLIERLNSELGMRYYFVPAQHIATIPQKLDCIKIKDYHIDNIIELNTKWK